MLASFLWSSGSWDWGNRQTEPVHLSNGVRHIDNSSSNLNQCYPPSICTGSRSYLLHNCFRNIQHGSTDTSFEQLRKGLELRVGSCCCGICLPKVLQLSVPASNHYVFNGYLMWVAVHLVLYSTAGDCWTRSSLNPSGRTQQCESFR